MRPADWPRDASLDERLLVLDPRTGTQTHSTVGALGDFLRAGDLLVVNDAATVPASLTARTAAGAPIEIRLAAPGHESTEWQAVLFGEGDWRTRTEHRAPPPDVRVGEVIRVVDALDATVTAVSPESARLVTLRFACDDDTFWQTVYAKGRPVQYAHLRAPLALWHAQTAYAGRPWSVEMPSAGRPLRWSLLAALRAQGVSLARITHAAGLSATGDDALDARLPLPERYEVPAETVDAIARTKRLGGRIVAVGTSVVRALEGCASAHGTLRATSGITALRIDGSTPVRVVDAVLSGMHEPDTSHFALLTAFAPAEHLHAAVREAEARGYLHHEFGDSVLVIAA